MIKCSDFGNIIIGEDNYEYDIIITLDNTVKKRQKKLSKNVHGTSHIISLQEAEYIYEEGAEILIIGSGQEGILTLADAAREYFREKNCKVIILSTPEAVNNWNKSKMKKIGLFHITC